MAGVDAGALDAPLLSLSEGEEDGSEEDDDDDREGL